MGIIIEVRWRSNAKVRAELGETEMAPSATGWNSLTVRDMWASGGCTEDAFPETAWEVGRRDGAESRSGQHVARTVLAIVYQME